MYMYTYVYVYIYIYIHSAFHFVHWQRERVPVSLPRSLKQCHHDIHKEAKRLFASSQRGREVHLKQCVAVCCSVLQCVAVCCSVVQCGAVWCSVLFKAMTCSTLQHTAAHCTECQCHHDIHKEAKRQEFNSAHSLRP